MTRTDEHGERLADLLHDPLEVRVDELIAVVGAAQDHGS
jgi:hypothetical protein